MDFASMPEGSFAPPTGDQTKLSLKPHCLCVIGRPKGRGLDRNVAKSSRVDQFTETEQMLVVREE
jgi:hypothetical protein